MWPSSRLSFSIAVPHAWNLDEDGRVVDITLPDDFVPPYERQYRGVAFSAARAHDCSWNGDASVLDDFNRGYPLLRERWQGDGSPGDLNGLRERIIADVLGFEGTNEWVRERIAEGFDRSRRSAAGGSKPLPAKSDF